MFVYPVESHDWLLFCLTLIGPVGSHDLIQLPLEFSTQLSSSGGINLSTRKPKGLKLSPLKTSFLAAGQV